jgi:hypothetical protein
MSGEDNAHLPEVTNEYRSADWMSASETIRRVRKATLSRSAHVAICARAHAGLVRARAELMLLGSDSRENYEVPTKFWWADGHDALTQNWETGDFETWIDKRFHMKAFGVTFHRDDIRRMVPDAFPESMTIEEPKNAGGRAMSLLWPDWVAELASHLHENGTPGGVGTKGADALIEAIASRLQERGLEAPSRSTVQDTVNAVLRRLRNQ